jgi:ABC-type protease/lipase transport system fused ATPase/permease subunit
MNRVALFIAASVIGGLGGFLGSVLGNAFGREGLFAGGFIGGALLAPVTAWIARWRHWIEPSQFWPVVAGAGVGFLAAATLAVNTLSSPVGPLIATTLTGLGALAGAWMGRRYARP